MGSSSKKTPWTYKDSCTFWFALFGGILALAQALPVVPWRHMQVNSNFGPRWGLDRQMSLFTVSDQFGQPQSWISMQRKVCLAVANMATPGISGTVGAIAAAAMGTGGGPIVGCAAWTECKNHAVNRCNSYKALAYIGIASFILHLLGALSCFVSCVTLLQEGTIKKKKKDKRAEAAWQTFLATLIGFLLVFVGGILWIVSSGMIIRGLQATSFYPYAGAFVGIIMCYITLVILFMAMCLGGLRYREILSADAAEQTALESYDENMAAQSAMMYDPLGNPVPMDPLMMGAPPPPNYGPW